MPLAYCRSDKYALSFSYADNINLLCGMRAREYMYVFSLLTTHNDERITVFEAASDKQQPQQNAVNLYGIN